MTQTIEPLNNQLFCEPVEEAKKTAAGILLANDNRKITAQAKVINTGPDVKSFKAHDHIFYKDYAATELLLNGQTYIIVGAEDVLGRIVEVEE
jgi:co-chaperonin GroES (HSP10)